MQRQKISEAICGIFADFSEDTAKAINDRNWRHVLHNAAIALISLFAAIGISTLIVSLLWKVLALVIKKLSLLTIPLIFILLFPLSVMLERSNTFQAHQKRLQKIDLETEAESIYEHVRDTMFRVFRKMSVYTAIVRPSSTDDIELPNGISIKDNFVVFSFFVRTTDTIDIPKFKRDMARDIRQVLKAHGCHCFPSDVVEIHGNYYTALQVYDVVDYGDSLTVLVVLANEYTVDVVKARKQLYLRAERRQEQKKEVPFDDEF